MSRAATPRAESPRTVEAAGQGPRGGHRLVALRVGLDVVRGGPVASVDAGAQAVREVVVGCSAMVHALLTQPGPDLLHDHLLTLLTPPPR